MIRRTLAPVALAALGLTLAGILLGLGPQARPGREAPSPPANDAPAATFAVDPVHSTALFGVHHLGAGRFWGRFNKIEGTFRFAEKGPATGEQLMIDVSIPIESVDTNNAKLDGHLKSPDFFNAKEYPTMRFRSTGAKRTADRTYAVEGELTIHGTSRTIRPTIEWIGTSDMGHGLRCGLEATFTIKRSTFGVMYGVENGMVGDEITVVVGLEGARQ